VKTEDLKDVGYDETKYGFIYLTTNNINGKMYIGQRKYDKRKEYKTYFGSGKLIKRAINKYGKENFSKIIICNTKNKNESNEKEKYYISLFNAVESDDFYNISEGGDGGSCLYGYTEQQKIEYRKHLSKSLKGNINQGANNPSSKKVICLNDLQVYDNITIASEENNISRGKLYAVLLKKQKCVKINDVYTLWEYYDETKKYNKISSDDIDLNSIRNVNISELYCYEDGKTYSSDEVCKRFNVTRHQLSCKIYNLNKHKDFSKISGGLLEDGILYHFKKIGMTKKKCIFSSASYY
jgi:hypothetical protein